MAVGLIGTTVVPYNIFLHTSFVKKKWNNPEELKIVRSDAFYSILIGGIIIMSILTASAVVNQHFNGKIHNITDMENQLKPLLGSWATAFMSIGFLAASVKSRLNLRVI